MKALILLSGGLDSTTLLYEYKSNIERAISFDYGSKHNAMELQSAKRICHELGIQQDIIDLTNIGKYLKSDLLLSGGDIPKGGYDKDNITKTVVPFRNGIMLSIAAGIAESHELDTILIANHFGDHEVYPDCRENFINSFADAVKYGTYKEIKILSPYCNIKKRDIALKGKDLNVPFELTYSCYVGGEKQCGECATCIDRKQALEGFDKTEYYV